MHATHPLCPEEQDQEEELMRAAIGCTGGPYAS